MYSVYQGRQTFDWYPVVQKVSEELASVIVITRLGECHSSLYVRVGKTIMGPLDKITWLTSVSLGMDRTHSSVMDCFIELTRPHLLKLFVVAFHRMLWPLLFSCCCSCLP